MKGLGRFTMKEGRCFESKRNRPIRRKRCVIRISLNRLSKVKFKKKSSIVTCILSNFVGIMIMLEMTSVTYMKFFKRVKDIKNV